MGQAPDENGEGIKGSLLFIFLLNFLVMWINNVEKFIKINLDAIIS
tara:strand:- start:1420 stop:1557 length:138 start_codon:yes stop_codon:yes gene_type:complete